jgi:hypothetical protein
MLSARSELGRHFEFGRHFETKKNLVIFENPSFLEAFCLDSPINYLNFCSIIPRIEASKRFRVFKILIRLNLIFWIDLERFHFLKTSLQYRISKFLWEMFLANFKRLMKSIKLTVPAFSAFNSSTKNQQTSEFP